MGKIEQISLLSDGFDYFGFLTNARRGAMRSKTQWVFNGPRLMAWTTKSPIWGNHLVP